VVSSALLALTAEAIILFFFVVDCGDLFTTSDYPIFSAGMNAKGYIAIGMTAQGIVSIGMMAEGLVTLSMVGSGLVVFVGQCGGGLGFGLYQVGVSWYCFLGQLTLSLWDTRAAQCGVNIFGPLFFREKRVFPTCNR
jgi:hypothetical protein